MLFEITHGYHHPSEEAMEESIKVVKKEPKKSSKKQEQLQSMMKGVTSSAYLQAIDYIKTNQFNLFKDMS